MSILANCHLVERPNPVYIWACSLSPFGKEEKTASLRWSFSCGKVEWEEADREKGEERDETSS
jgi:hypothetical protein